MKTRIIPWIEGVLFVGLLWAANAGLWRGEPRTDWVFLPSAVLQGEWARLLLHPWVHVSGYHLILDASAFLSLFFMLDRSRPFERWRILGGAWAVAWIVVWWGEPAVKTLGLCGLSGIAHGLFAAVCIQWIRRPELRRTGAFLLTGLIGKVALEVITGEILIGTLHAGSVGHPLILCHLGGAFGGWVSAVPLGMKESMLKAGLPRHPAIMN